MIAYFTRHPTAANLLMGLFLFAGLLVLPEIKRETFPEINSYEMQIQVPYPGAAPIDVETGICRPLEDALDGISFMEEKRCEARNSLGIMTAKMLEAGNFEQFKDDVKRAVDSINNFPENAEEATVQELGTTQDVITLAIVANLPQTELKTLAETLKQKMLRDPAIPLVTIQGFATRQYQIQISQEHLRQYGLSLSDIASRVGAQNLDLPSGDIKTATRDFQIRFSDEKRSIEELENLIILGGDQRTEVRLGEIATIIDTFEQKENKVTYNGLPAALLKVSKNSQDDSLRTLAAVQQFVEQEQLVLPEQVHLELTQDFTSIIRDRIQMLSTNAWQGLLLVFIVMWLFFGTRYAFWVSMGLPVSFLASALILGNMGITINMLSMVALLLALGILMDDAIVISESIGAQIRKGKSPMQAAVEGTRIVGRGVFSSFLTTLCVFSGLLFLKGDIGQVLVVVPIVLLSVISVSLIEAFFILPNHLQHSLAHVKKDSAFNQLEARFRQRFDALFETLRLKVDGLVHQLIHFRYVFTGLVIALLMLSVSLLTTGVIKFSPFPNVEGDVVQARILMPTGTSLERTEAVVAHMVNGLKQTDREFAHADQPAINSYTVNYSTHADAFESGPHLATISVDLLTAEKRDFAVQAFIQTWRQHAGEIADAWSVAIKEPAIGPSGRAIHIRLQGEDLNQLSAASHTLQTWLAGYPGVSNLMDDLRPGKPEFTLHLKPGAYSLGLTAQTIASQLRAAYQGQKIIESTIGLETFEITVILDDASRDDLGDFDQFPIIHPTSGAVIPLSEVAEIQLERSYSRIQRIGNQRTVTIFGDVNAALGNTGEILADVKRTIIPELQADYPEVTIAFEGEAKNGAETQNSMKTAFLLGLAGIFILLSFQFKSYVEPIVVMLNIPLAFIGVIWGHWIMGLEITMPSLLGFVSLAGIVVNDSILLVEFVKIRAAEGLSVHEAAAKASHDRFRAVLLTSLTTIAGMTPLLFETSLQAQILIPLATSIVFGIASSTLLVLFVVPCVYTIMEDFGFATASKNTEEAGEFHAT